MLAPFDTLFQWRKSFSKIYLFNFKKLELVLKFGKLDLL